MSFVRAQQLVKQYGSGESCVTAISDISFEIDEGEFVAIMGESGAGKSTLLAVLGAINEPTGGSLVVDDIEVYRLTPEQRADFRREYLGFVFQSFHLVPYLTVLENVMLPLAVVKAGRQAKRELAAEALKQVGLSGKADRLPNQISGGEKERVAVARAVVNKPPVLLADEPTGNLDSGNSKEIMKLLQALNREGTTIVMVTHSNDCARFARRTLQVSDGTIVGESHNLPIPADIPN
ncbi:MAG: ABC transporter ATP-binding protein [Deltaproteobacteria bacterium SG8_13]|nr:MAG: ABC transporter ATP-binding protein [Deltaproteobacteria bacterium SG8_13]